MLKVIVFSDSNRLSIDYLFSFTDGAVIASSSGHCQEAPKGFYWSKKITAQQDKADWQAI